MGGYSAKKIRNIAPDILVLAGKGDTAAMDAAETALPALVKAGQRNVLQRLSMRLDMLKGYKTEIGCINGFVAAAGAKAKLAVPANAVLGRIERSEIPARLKNIIGIDF